MQSRMFKVTCRVLKGGGLGVRVCQDKHSSRPPHVQSPCAARRGQHVRAGQKGQGHGSVWPYTEEMKRSGNPRGVARVGRTHQLRIICDAKATGNANGATARRLLLKRMDNWHMARCPNSSRQSKTPTRDTKVGSLASRRCSHPCPGLTGGPSCSE